jgi:phage terminase large subunit-like protein
MTKKKSKSPSRQSKRPAPRPPKPAAVDPTPHVTAALGYCRDVLAGTIPAAKVTKLACKRHLKDLKRAGTADEPADPDFPFYFDPVQAERVCRFIEMLPHVKGKWARPDPLNPDSNLIRMEPWQSFFVCSIFGWLTCGTARLLPSGRSIGLRRFREAELWVARKNAKSTIAAGIGHWMFTKDEEPGAEVYCGAGTEKQAWEVFGPARQMCVSKPKNTRDLGITINARSLLRQVSGSMSKFEPVIGKPGDGASPHCAIVDEYHEHPTSEQFDTFHTGMAAREQPLMLIISTAGANISSPARERWRSAEQILHGTIREDRRFVLIYTVDDPEEDWKTETGLRMANPNWDVSVNRSFILSALETARREAKAQATFKTKHANIWVAASAAYFNIETWNRCRAAGLNLEAFRGQTVYLAGDLASKVNLAAVARVVPIPDESYAAFVRYYSPRATVQLPQNEHLFRWAQQGWITVTEGNTIDFHRIRDDIFADCATYQVPEIALDPWQAAWLINELRGANKPAFELRQIVAHMSEPMKTLDALQRNGRLKHDGNPVTAWCIANVVATVDAKENVYPRKERDSEFIDGAVAIIMALARAHLKGGQKPSVYAGRGVRRLGD